MAKSATKTATTQNVKIIILLVIALGGLLFSSIYAYSWLSEGPRFAEGPATPEVAESVELTEKLKSDPRFKDLEIIAPVEGNTWRCAGSVRSQADAEAAMARAKELKPGVEWSFELPTR